MALDALRCPERRYPHQRPLRWKRRQVALCRLLLSQPDVLLLDNRPTTSTPSVLWLEQYLQQFARHRHRRHARRYFLDNVAGWILRARPREGGIPWENGYSPGSNRGQSASNRKNVRRVQAPQDPPAHELEWIRMSPKARQAKRKMSECYRQARQRRDPGERKTGTLHSPGRDWATWSSEADHITKSYDGRIIIDDLSFNIPKNAVVGIIGPNSVSKTTLFRMIMGQNSPTKVHHLGDTVQLAYVDQEEPRTCCGRPCLMSFRWIGSHYGGKTEVNAQQAYLSRFNFPGLTNRKGGCPLRWKRNRLHLAITPSREGGNVLLLDRTNQRHRCQHPAFTGGAIENFTGCA